MARFIGCAGFVVAASLCLGSCRAPLASDLSPSDSSQTPASPENATQQNAIQQGKTVTILGTLTGVGAEKLQQSMVPFTEATGIEVIYEGTDAFATLVAVRVDSGDAPDLALFPQPGLLLDFAETGQMVPLTTTLSREALAKAYDDYLLDLVAVEQDIYGLWMRADVKSLVWYNPKAFAAQGYTIPKTWDELQMLTERISAEGNVPWCIGLESGSATGWVGTDWIEDILLRKFGPEVYDQWVNHQIPFTDPRVEAVFDTFGTIARNPDYALGGPTGVIGTPFGDSPKPLFEPSPGCYLHRQASFIGEFLPEGLELGVDVGVFSLPPMDPSQGSAVILGGIAFGAFNDTPEVRAFVNYLATPEPHRIWAGLGSYISPHQQVELTAYPDALTRQQAEILRNAEVLRFDGSDQMPGAVGAGTFWSGIVDYVAGQDADQVLAEIEASWPEND